MLIKNAKIVLSGNDTEIVDILIKNGKITKIDKKITHEGIIIDANHQLVMPGCIDVHVHLREPGYTHKETIASASLAALKGGYTTIFAMPNVYPYVDTKNHIEKYLEILNKHNSVNILPYACITKDQKGIDLVDFSILEKFKIQQVSDDGKGIQDINLVEKAMYSAKKFNLLFASHAEDTSLIPKNASMHDGEYNQRLKQIGISSASEYLQVARELALAKKTKVRYHLCHVSCLESIELIKNYKKQMIDVSCEVTAHHLLLCDQDVKDTNFKMNPPLRSKCDQQALINGLLEGTIDMIASDHAPHTKQEKNQNFEDAPFGVIGLETTLPLIYTYFFKKGLANLQQIQNWLSFNPAKRFNLKTKGLIRVGYDADLIIVSEEKNKIDVNEMASLSKNSPFHDLEVDLVVQTSIVNGEIKYQRRK